MFEKSTYTTILQALTPIAHHSESFGNSAIVMDEPVIQPDGRKARVPIITGDTMRHGLREAAAYAFLDAAGLLDEPCLTEAALRLLFSGGQLGGPSGSTVSISEYRSMVDLVPSLGLLGGCAGNRMQPGRLQVDRALLVCAEAMPLLEHDPWVMERIGADGFEPPAARASKDLVQRVRMDPTLSPTSRAMLAPSANASAEGRILASEAASESGDAIAIADSKSSMMPRTFEVVAAGSRFVWSLTVQLLSELDRDTFDLMLAAWLSNMVVGGKKGTGHGRLVALEGSRRLLSRPSAPETVTLPDASRVGDRFREHVSSRKDQIKDFLATVVA